MVYHLTACKNFMSKKSIINGSFVHTPGQVSYSAAFTNAGVAVTGIQLKQPRAESACTKATRSRFNTHQIFPRGHKSNTFKQLYIYKHLGRLQYNDHRYKLGCAPF